MYFTNYSDDLTITLSQDDTRAERAGGSGRAGVSATASIAAGGEGRLAVTVLSGDLFIGVARAGFDLTVASVSLMYSYYTCGYVKIEGDNSVAAADCGTVATASPGDTVVIDISNGEFSVEVDDEVCLHRALSHFLVGQQTPRSSPSFNCMRTSFVFCKSLMVVVLGALHRLRD